VGDVAEYARGVLREVAEGIGCEVLALEVMPDHVHVLLLCPPRLAPSYIANYLKGKSARRILQRFPQLRARVGRLWSRSYFVATVGNVTADIVERYVEEQWSKDEKV